MLAAPGGAPGLWVKVRKPCVFQQANPSVLQEGNYSTRSKTPGGPNEPHRDSEWATVSRSHGDGL